MNFYSELNTPQSILIRNRRSLDVATWTSTMHLNSYDAALFKITAIRT